MRKRNTPIRMITVRPAQPRERTTMLALARRFGFSAGASAPAVFGTEVTITVRSVTW